MALSNPSLRLDADGTAINAKANTYVADNWRLDVAMVITAALFLFGLYLDGWAHNNLSSSLETFFTPWHAVLYGGFFLVAGVTVASLIQGMLRGHGWRYALPRGYFLTLIGIGLFTAAGIGDMFWHEIFGIEANVEALLSPAHLALATGGFLFITGPLRAIWGRKTGVNPGWKVLGPAIGSLFMSVAGVLFFAQYAHFLNDPEFMVRRFGGNSYFLDVYGITSMVLPMSICMGGLLLLMRRWTVPSGTVTLVIGGTSAMAFLMNWNATQEYGLILVAIFAGCLVSEGLIAALRPSPSRVGAVRAVAFLVPALVGIAYFGSLIATSGIWWSIHMWLGVVFETSAASLLLSFLVFPPQSGDEASALG